MQTIIKIGIAIAIGLVFGGIIITIVLTVTAGYVSSDRCENIYLPYSLWVSNNNGSYLISWYASSLNSECDFTYNLQYSVDGGQEFYVNTTVSNHTIPNLNLENCSILQLRLWVISRSGTISEDSVNSTYKELPSGVRHTEINHTTVNDGLLLTWNKPIEFVRCEVNYTLVITTDLTTINANSVTESVLVPDDKYCFRVTTTMDAWIDSRNVYWATSYYSDRRAMDSDRIIISPANSQELIVTWDNHRKEELCDVEYDVGLSSDGDVYEQFFNVTSPEARFNFSYCAEAVVAIDTYGLNRRTWGPYAIVDATQWPKAPIGKVQDITVDDLRDGFITVAWKSAVYVNQCNIEYTVTATHPTAGKATCSGLSSCNITLNDYCPGTILVIVATSLDGQPISGEDIAHTHICNSSRI